MKNILLTKCLTVIVLAFGFVSLNGQTFVKTTASGSGDGTSWDNALGAADLATAIDAGGIVYIAEGTYTPGTIDLSNDVDVIGGFPSGSTGTNIAPYNPALYETTIDGATSRIFNESGADNILIRGLILENAGGSGSVFDGTAGSADILWEFEDLVVQNNNSSNGAIQVSSTTGSNASIAIRDSYFANNTSSNGGALYMSTVYNDNDEGQVNQGNFVIDNTAFVDNSSSLFGGAIYLTTSHAWNITNSCFSGNTAGSDGGAIFFTTSYANFISNTSFTDNTSDEGGALHLTTAYAEINDVDFINNIALDQGGAMYLTTATAEMTDAGFYGNTADSDGGAVYSSTAFSIIGLVPNSAVNSTFYDNTVTGNGDGGALSVAAASNIWNIDNTVFNSNSVPAGRTGGAITSSSVDVTIDGSTFYENTIDGTANIPGSDLEGDDYLDITNSTMQLANSAAYTAGSYNFGAGNTFNNTTNPFTVVPAPQGCSNPLVILFLPVEMLYFNANSSGADVVLDWATATEENNSHFEIERSINGIDFETIGEVTGNGTTQQEQRYMYIDVNASNLGAELVYYRLRQVDIDGASAFSDIKIASFDVDGFSAMVYPNPIGNYTSEITLSAKKINQIDVYDSYGRLVYTETYSSVKQRITIPTDVMAVSGIYFIRIDRKETIKVIK